MASTPLGPAKSEPRSATDEMRRRIWARWTAAALAGVILFGAPAMGEAKAGGDGGTCPPDHPAAREMAVAFLDGPSFADDAAALGMTPADSLTMRLLTGPADSIACNHLEAQLAPGVTGYPYVHSFYQVRGHYIVGIGVPSEATGSLNADGTITIISRRTFVAVFNSAFQVVGSYAL